MELYGDTLDESASFCKAHEKSVGSDIRCSHEQRSPAILRIRLPREHYRSVA